MADNSQGSFGEMNGDWEEGNLSVLFVCSANQFRSPLAAAFFQNLLVENQMWATWSVTSAGTWTEDGLSLIPSPSWALDNFNLDLSSHRSKAIDKHLVARYDVVIVMEKDQKEALQIEYPEMRTKILMLTDFSNGPPYDIPDPTKIQEESFFKIANEIKNLLNENFLEICRRTIILKKINSSD